MIGAALVCLAALGSCTALVPPGAENIDIPTPVVLACQGERVVMIVEQPLGCDVSPPQYLDVRFPGSDGIEEPEFQITCDNMGGRLGWSPQFDPAGEFVCWGVDY